MTIHLFGRPMIYEGFAFTDKVSRRSVSYYRDRKTGKWYLSEHRWAVFRVPAGGRL